MQRILHARLDYLLIYLPTQVQLTLTKIIKIVATRWRILRLKCTKFDFGWGSAPDPAGGAYSAPQTPSWIWGPYPTIWRKFTPMSTAYLTQRISFNNCHNSSVTIDFGIIRIIHCFKIAQKLSRCFATDWEKSKTRHCKIFQPELRAASGLHDHNVMRRNLRVTYGMNGV